MTARQGWARDVPGLILSDSNARELTDARKQREAVFKIVKDDLSRKLNSLFIIYSILVVLISTAIFIRALVLPQLGGIADAMIFFAANGLYFCFLMLLSFAYELYLRTRWHIALVTVAFFLLVTVMQPVLTITKPRLLVGSVAGAMFFLLLAGFLKRTQTGKRWRSFIKKTQKNNQKTNEDREAYKKRAIEFLLRGQDKMPAHRRHTLEIILRSALNVTYTIRETKECVDQKGAVEEFVKRHRFRDSMGRLAAAMWVAGALGYMILPIPEAAGTAYLVTLKVLPVYGAVLFMIERFDEAREKAFAEVLKIIEPRIG
jgi:hypothetical protein